ncbi:MAG: NAD(P)H-dependent glycerol-3-phosphate dehydrogenase [Burkholderiaceae bacterium]
MSDLMPGPILVLGAGAWGTALSVHLARRAEPNSVSLWARDAALAERIAHDRVNSRYLPEIPFPEALFVWASLEDALTSWRSRVAGQEGLGLLVLATPVSGLRALAEAVAKTLGPPRDREAVLWLSKGLAVTPEGLLWPNDLVAGPLASWPRGALTGPSFAQEVARGLPCALTLASADPVFARQAARVCHGGSMRVYASGDLVGAQLGGAMKNVLAIAAGVADGLALGANARAALITRGLAETARLGLSLGAQPQSFLGLATLGDLILTATGDLSRNRRVGIALAKGQPLSEILSGLGHVAEGVYTAPAIRSLGQEHGVCLPIVQAVCQLLSGSASVATVLQELLDRDPVDEDPSAHP